MTANDNDWIGEKILAQEDRLLEALAAKRFRDVEGRDEPASPQPVDRDPAAEKQAFADLLKFVADTPEDDCDFTGLSLDDFAAETFNPPATDEAN